MKFSAASLPILPRGTERDFFLASSGWDKDSDFHVKRGTTVEPLPWHGMSDQNYGHERRPTFTNDAWIERYNSRWVGPRVLSRRK